jgi:hypothetical protein
LVVLRGIWRVQGGVKGGNRKPPYSFLRPCKRDTNIEYQHNLIIVYLRGILMMYMELSLTSVALVAEDENET